MYAVTIINNKFSGGIADLLSKSEKTGGTNVKKQFNTKRRKDIENFLKDIIQDGYVYILNKKNDVESLPALSINDSYLFFRSLPIQDFLTSFSNWDDTFIHQLTPLTSNIQSNLDDCNKSTLNCNTNLSFCFSHFAEYKDVRLVSNNLGLDLLNIPEIKFGNLYLAYTCMIIL